MLPGLPLPISDQYIFGTRPPARNAPSSLAQYERWRLPQVGPGLPRWGQLGTAACQVWDTATWSRRAAMRLEKGGWSCAWGTHGESLVVGGFSGIYHLT